MQSVGFGIRGLGLSVWGLGFGVWGLGFGVWSLGFGGWGVGFGGRVWGQGCWVWGVDLGYEALKLYLWPPLPRGALSCQRDALALHTKERKRDIDWQENEGRLFSVR